MPCVERTSAPAAAAAFEGPAFEGPASAIALAAARSRASPGQQRSPVRRGGALEATSATEEERREEGKRGEENGLTTS